MLSLTPPALHSLHSICSGGVLVSGGALDLFSLDVCMCQQGGEVSDRTKGKLFDFSKTCCAQGFESAYVVRIALVRGKCIQWEFLLCLAPGFPSASGMTVSSPTSVFEESCLCLIDCVEPLPLS